MKFTCTQSDFNAHLSLVNRAVPSRPSHPVLANVLLTADSNAQQISLTGFDLSLGVQTSFQAQVEQGGTLTLPAKLLSDIVSRLPDEDITLDEDGELIVVIKSKSGKYQIRGMDASEYPDLPTISESKRTNLSTAVLTSGINGTLFAASTEESKQTLCGVHVAIENNGIEFAATNGHVMSCASSKCEGLTDSIAVIIPTKAMREFNRLCDLANGESVSVAHDYGQIVFQWPNQRLTSRLIEGQYPNYRQLIPKQFASNVVFNRKAMIAALERISVLAEQKNNVVVFDVADGELAISVEAADVGSGREAIECVLKGSAITLAFNVRYLVEGFKSFDCESLTLSMNTPLSPVIFENAETTEWNRVYLVMPIAIREQLCK